MGSGKHPVQHAWLHIHIFKTLQKANKVRASLISRRRMVEGAGNTTEKSLFQGPARWHSLIDKILFNASPAGNLSNK